MATKMTSDMTLPIIDVTTFIMIKPITMAAPDTPKARVFMVSMSVVAQIAFIATP